MDAKSEVVRLERIVDSDFRMRLELESPAMRELVASVRRDGVIVPVILERVGDGFRVVAGHRRCAAAREADLGCVPAQVVDAGTVDSWSIAFAENLFRKDLSPIEEACAVVDCLEDGDRTIEQVGSMIGRSAQWVKERIVIASWPDDLQGAVHRGLISASAGWNLAQISDEAQRQTLIAYAAENGATARTTAAWLQAWRSSAGSVDPECVDASERAPGPPPLEPYLPCLLCERKMKMIDLRYQPICPECTPMLIELGRELRSREVPAGPGG